MQEKKQTDLLVFLKWGNSVENYELTQWNNNNNLTQTLSSLTDVSDGKWRGVELTGGSDVKGSVFEVKWGKESKLRKSTKKKKKH